MKNKDFYKSVISTLGKNAFEKFCSIALVPEAKLQCGFDDLKLFKSNIFEINYYNFENPYPHNGKEAYFVNYIPINLLMRLSSDGCFFDDVINSLQDYMHLPHDDVDFLGDEFPLINMGIISNIFGATEDYFFEKIAPAYTRAINIKNLILEPNFSLQLGTIDSMIDNMTIENIEYKVTQFFNTYRDGLTIGFNESGFQVNEYTTLQEMASGGTKKTFSPLEPIRTIGSENKVLIEFEKLLNSDTSEKRLEEFLKSYYHILFPQYNSISTQLWLRFPEIDIACKERRLDIFMRNAITNDWDLYELKKANQLLIKGNDVPTIRAKILDSIMQLKAYKRLLSQDHVRRTLAEEGVEYFEPNYFLVIGQTPNIEFSRWRWLQNEIAEKNLKIKTYDEILREAQTISKKILL